MTRTDFLKTLGLGVGGAILPDNPFISSRAVKIYDNYVRGLTHYHFAKVKNNIKDGDEITLLREPENLYDRFAIQVNFNEHRLGYVAAYENIVLANMLDAGVKLNAYVSQKNLKLHFTEWLALEVFADLVTPSQKLIDSMLAENRADDATDIYRQ
jgi:hypothetical protein